MLWDHEVTRIFDGADRKRFDADVTPEDDRIPYTWGTEITRGVFQLTRSFGRRYKYDASFGLEANRRVYRPREMGSIAPEAVAEFVSDVMPVSDTQIGPFAQLESYTSDFARLLDVNTLALQEDFRLGPRTILRMSPASSELGSSRDLLATFAGVSYTAALWGGLFRVAAESTIDCARAGRHDAAVALGARIVSPPLGIGRLLLDGSLLNRYKNYLNRTTFIGGDGRLRGYPPNAFDGKDAVAGNVEFRSTSVEIFSAHVGGALFYDAGNAFDGFDRFALNHSAGIGTRILIPQANRVVFRADWGFPLFNDRFKSLPGGFFVTFGQAFAMPGLSAPTLLSLFAE
jgi:hypothetical protein